MCKSTNITFMKIKKKNYWGNQNATCLVRESPVQYAANIWNGMWNNPLQCLGNLVYGKEAFHNVVRKPAHLTGNSLFAVLAKITHATQWSPFALSSSRCQFKDIHELQAANPHGPGTVPLSQKTGDPSQTNLALLNCSSMTSCREFSTIYWLSDNHSLRRQVSQILQGPRMLKFFV